MDDFCIFSIFFYKYYTNSRIFEEFSKIKTNDLFRDLIFNSNIVVYVAPFLIGQYHQLQLMLSNMQKKYLVTSNQN